VRFGGDSVAGGTSRCLAVPAVPGPVPVPCHGRGPCAALGPAGVGSTLQGAFSCCCRCVREERRAPVSLALRAMPWAGTQAAQARVGSLSFPPAGWPWAAEPSAASSGQAHGAGLRLRPGVSAATRRPRWRGRRDSQGPSPRHLADLHKAKQQTFKKMTLWLMELKSLIKLEKWGDSKWTFIKSAYF